MQKAEQAGLSLSDDAVQAQKLDAAVDSCGDVCSLKETVGPR